MQHAFASPYMLLIKRICTWFVRFRFEFHRQVNAQFETVAVFFLSSIYAVVFGRSFVAFTINSFSFLSSQERNSKRKKKQLLATIYKMICDFSCCSQKRECKCAKMQHESFVINIHRSISPTNIYATYFFYWFSFFFSLSFPIDNWKKSTIISIIENALEKKFYCCIF